jgi:NAD-dependent SIR2 family protein deacetylase
LTYNPTAVVDIRLFQYNQFPYLEVRRPFILGTASRKWKPTASHYFFKVLDDKQLLQRLYTQNIDGLDYHTGINKSKIVSVHGSIEMIECEFCKTSYDMNEFQQQIRTKIKNIYDIYDLEAPVESSNIICSKCKKPGIKPATVLYGTNLPSLFFQKKLEDFPHNVDLLIIAGSSLTVQPACNLVKEVNDQCPRILINRDLVGTELGISSDRDQLILSDCDDGFIELAKQLGWLHELYCYSDQMCDSSKTKVTKAYQDSLE